MEHVCRCCLSKTCFKDISNEYVIAGQKEVYSDMLFNTFNINISYQGDSMRLICEVCITRLRDAADFKKQVERAEEAITKKLFSQRICESTDLNLIHYDDDFLDHITGEFDDDEIDSHSNHDTGWHDDGGDEIMIKLEAQDEDDVPLILRMKKKLKKKPPKYLADCMKNKDVSDTETHKKPLKKKKQKRSLPQLARKENSLKLLNNSNICLFESLKTKFRCFYCKNAYLKITDLREHSKTHSNPSYLKMCINRLQGMSYKNVDISNLLCKICNDPLKDLTDLRGHLTELHNIEFHNDDHILIPYKLENDFQCVLCDQMFNSFLKLSVHMNVHFSNHVCEICGASYINRLSLRMHVNSRHREMKCSVCSAIFSSAYLRVKHMRKIHNSSQSKRYCLLCNKTFRYTYMLNEHKIQEHGMKRQLAICPECGKTFLSPVNLRTHIRSVHMKERNHPCAFCGMRFFTSCDTRRHERTHQDVRLFSCSYCESRFKSKDSLRRHLKRQHGNIFNIDSDNRTHV